MEKNGTARLLREVLFPSGEFTPIPFWFFNDEPDKEKIKAQLKDYVEKGVEGIVLHPRIGVPESVAYLSEEYFAAVRFIVETAAELGMKIVLYDEAMYPSGSAHGMVVAANPEFASKGITLVENERQVPEDAQVLARLLDGRLLVYTFTKGTIRGIHFGEDDGESGAPPSADILNPAAVEMFIQLTHERYYEELKEYFGNTIIAFFTDEPCALGRNAGAFREWVPGMEKELDGRLEELAALFSGEENAATELYHRLIKKHLREIFYKRLSDWCQSHGIALMGHPEASDDVEEELYFHIPGQDLIMRRVSPETGGITEPDSVQAKLSADIARHLGRRRNANECFGVCCRDKISWYFTGADMKWYIDWLGIRGVNLFVPHAFYYSVEGARKEERPPDVGPNNIWWKHYRKVSDYIKRISFLMTDSINSAKVAVLCDNNRVPDKELAVLYENQIEFNYLPVALLSECCYREGRLCIGEYAYEAVINVTDEGWNDILAALPVRTEKETETEGAVRLLRSVDMVLADMRLRTVQTKQPCSGLRVSGLCKYGKKMYLFSNEGEEAVRTQVSIPAEGVPVKVHLWKGGFFDTDSRTEEGQTVIELVLEKRETLLVLLAEDAAEAEDALSAMPSKLLLPAGEKYLGDWTERFTLKEKAAGEKNCAEYTLHYCAEEICGTESFSVCGEEMAECYCNGEPVDVSLWGVHKFQIGAYLHKGENLIELKMTGNAANIYCDAGLPYGLFSR